MTNSFSCALPVDVVLRSQPEHSTAHPLALQREQLKLKEGVRRRRVLSGREVKVSLLTQIFVSLSTGFPYADFWSVHPGVVAALLGT